MYIKDLNIVRCAGVNPKLMTCLLYCVYYSHTRCTESSVHALYGIIVMVCVICALVSQPLKCGLHISCSSASEVVRKDRRRWVISQKWLKNIDNFSKLHCILTMFTLYSMQFNFLVLSTLCHSFCFFEWPHSCWVSTLTMINNSTMTTMRTTTTTAAAAPVSTTTIIIILFFNFSALFTWI